VTSEMRFLSPQSAHLEMELLVAQDQSTYTGSPPPISLIQRYPRYLRFAVLDVSHATSSPPRETESAEREKTAPNLKGLHNNHRLPRFGNAHLPVHSTMHITSADNLPRPIVGCAPHYEGNSASL